MKPASAPTDLAQQPRRAVRLPVDLGRQLRAVIEARGDIGAQLVRGWLDDAVTRACLGLPLPLADLVPTGGETVRLPWAQTEEDYQAAVELLKVYRSSPRAVIYERAQLHVQTGGNRAAAGVLLLQRYGDRDHLVARSYQHDAADVIRRVMRTHEVPGLDLATAS